MPRPNKGHKLERQKNGIWWIVWYDQGKRNSISTRQTSQAAAYEFLAWRLAEGVDKTPVVIGVDRVLADYWSEHVMDRVVDRKRIDYAIRNLSWFSSMPVEDVDNAVVGRYVSGRRSGRIGRTSGDGTIRRELGVLRAAINHAIRERRISAEKVRWFHIPESPPARERVLTRCEVKSLMAESRYTSLPDADGKFTRGLPPRMSRLYRFVMIAYWTAARRRSVEGLTWSQVDLNAMKIDLNPKGRRQTSKRKPVVPIFNGLFQVLVQAKSEAISEYVLDHPGDVRQSFDRACKRLGLDDVTPHTLRHSCAVHRAQEGGDLYAIAGLLGDDIKTVYRNYLHHCPDHLRNALGGIDSGDVLLKV